MLSAYALQDIVNTATRKAKSAGRAPLSIKEFDSKDPYLFIKRIPFLGTYVRTGWEAADSIDDLFVDKTGWDNSGPALSIPAFIQRLNAFALSGDNYGFGIVEEGEFQLYIRVYRPDSRDFTHSGNLTEKELRILG
jgi:hypothetical protein